MSPHSPSQPSKNPARHSDTKETRQAPQRATQPRVRSVLIEPRDNEPPRVSISVEYTGEAPGMKALKKLTTDVLHDVCRAQTFVDLGYRAQQTQRTLTQTFSLEEK